MGVGSLRWNPLIFLALVLSAYGLLLLPTLSRQGISWDEQTDIDIARAYLALPDGWIHGSDSDPSQARLPMAVVALVWALLGRSSLWLSRLVSALLGALTIVGVYVYGRVELDEFKGVLAGAILATSPFFLSFARVAFTETDVYVACALSWVLVGMSRLRTTRSVGWAAASALALGCAVSSKFTVVYAFPAVLIAALLWTGESAPGAHLTNRQTLVGATLLVLASLAVPAGWVLAGANYEGAWPQIHYGAVLLAWLMLLGWIARNRARKARPLLLALFLLGMATLTALTLPPVHTTNPDILRSLMDRFDNEMVWSPSFMVEAAGLHLTSLVFKSSVGVGLGLLLAAAAAATQFWHRAAVRFPLLLVVFYLAGLLLLPLAQTFYMVPLLPVLALLAADQFLELWKRRRPLALLSGGAVAAGLAVDLVLCYPDYNLNGYQWLGARYLVGRSTIGYRSVVQTPSDGVEQATRWVCANAKAGDRVLAFVHPWHIVSAACPQPPFRFMAGEGASVRSGPEYVVIHINHQIRQRWAGNPPGADIFWEPLDRQWLLQHYSKVYAVQRRFGLEVASVWRRNG